MVKNLPASARDIRDMDSIPGWEDPLEEVMVTHSRFLPGESYGQRSLASYSPWIHNESDMTETNEHACRRCMSH